MQGQILIVNIISMIYNATDWETGVQSSVFLTC